MPEAIINLGCVPIAEYGTPSTMEIPDNVEKYLQYYDAVLLENHGALTWGSDLIGAYHKMESVEFYAELIYRTKMLGGPKELSKQQIERLYEIRRVYGLPDRHPAELCQNRAGVNCHNCSAATFATGDTKPETARAETAVHRDNWSPENADLIDRITQQVVKALKPQ
jgi:L-fuculose-phosphate aldolase